MTTIRIGIIGYGDHMREKLLPAIKTLKEKGYDVELVAVCKKTDRDLEKIKKELNVHTTTNYEELLDKNTLQLNAVIAALPDADAHAEIVRKSLEAGIHVFVEKPVTLRMNVLDMLTQLARENHEIMTSVGFNLTFSPILEDVRESLLHNKSDIQISCEVKNYVANPDLEDVIRSGINFALIHPISVAVDLLGPPDNVEVLSLQPIRDKDGCFELIVEMNYPGRTISLRYNNAASGSKFTLEYDDQGKQKIVDLAAKDKASTGEFKDISFKQATYIEELKEFFNSINSGKQGKNSLLGDNVQIIHQITRLILVDALEKFKELGPASSTPGF